MAIDESVLEGAFVEAFGLLAGNFDDVLDIVMNAVEDSLTNGDDAEEKHSLKRIFRW